MNRSGEQSGEAVWMVKAVLPFLVRTLDLRQSKAHSGRVITHPYVALMLIVSPLWIRGPRSVPTSSPAC